MWVLVLITTINAVLNQYSFQNVNRLSFGFVQIGVVEITMLLGLGLALLRGGSQRAQFPTATHPAFLWIMVCLAIGFVFGAIGAVIEDVPLKFGLASAREFASVPICLVIGYRMMARPSQGKSMAILWTIAGTVTAGILLMSFGAQTEAASISGGLNPLRRIILDYNAEYALMGAMILLYSIVVAVNYLPLPLALCLSIFCFAGYVAPLSRTSFLEITACLLACYFIMPKEKRFGKVAKAVFLAPIIAGAMYGALLIADAAIGRDFAGKVEKHIMTMMPGKRESTTESRAWDSRLPAIIEELQLWMTNPLMGRGFWSQDKLMYAGKISAAGFGYNHNVWTSTLAKTGIIGFAGVVAVVGSMIVLGRRMIRDKLDSADMLMGALGFVCGVALLVRASCTMAITSRASMDFGLICGALIRAREMQLARRAMEAAYEQPQYDDQTDLLATYPQLQQQQHWGYN